MQAPEAHRSLLPSNLELTAQATDPMERFTPAIPEAPPPLPRWARGGASDGFAAALSIRHPDPSAPSLPGSLKSDACPAWLRPQSAGYRESRKQNQSADSAMQSGSDAAGRACCSRPRTAPGRRRAALAGGRYTLCGHEPTPVQNLWKSQPPQPLGCGPLLQGCSAGCNSANACSPTVQFEVPSEAQRIAALGSHVGLPYILQRIMKFAPVWFEQVPEPRVHDWLHMRSEFMQSFEAFRTVFEERHGMMGPTKDRQCLHLLPIGAWVEHQALLAKLQDLCGAFFWPLRVSLQKADARLEDVVESTGTLDADEVLASVRQRAPSDAVVCVAITLSPLSVRGQPTVGASDWEHRSCVFSLAPCLEKPNGSQVPCGPLSSELDSARPEVFERLGKMMLHSITHMFGVLHCCFFRCLMNGASTVDELDRTPAFLCAMCLKKLHHVLCFEPLDRYVRLSHAWNRAGCQGIARWYEMRVALIRSSLPKPPPPAVLLHSDREKPKRPLSAVQRCTYAEGKPHEVQESTGSRRNRRLLQPGSHANAGERKTSPRSDRNKYNLGAMQPLEVALRMSSMEERKIQKKWAVIGAKYWRERMKPL
eukprot:TRINITY_DN46977_c0_g1_i1.p1 TRINITY_DN46977_c0_g1~~TRINITY_DN46977_c0_g1_i1.p1  ORF type:complete len:593 (+),score=98.48 TRINITY_DN46977_c0_g1_i1:121-1899(+)